MTMQSRRRLMVGLSVIAVLAIILGGLGWMAVQRSMPVVQGNLTVPGLHGQVDVFRDAYGIPEHLRLRRA